VVGSGRRIFSAMEYISAVQGHPRSLILAPSKGRMRLPISHHRRSVAQHCINGDSLSQWRRAKFDPHRMENPELIAKKFGTVDCVPQATPVPNFVQIRPREASQKMRKI